MDRTKGIGGSDIAVILGLSPYKTPRELWEEKTGQREPTEQSWAMRRGNALEQDLLQEYERQTGNIVVRHPEQVPIPDSLERFGFPILISVDGDCPGARVLVEAKATSNHSRFKDALVPEDYQCQGDLYCRFAHEVFGGEPRLHVDFPVDDVGTFRILRHDYDAWSTEELVLPAGKAFWQCVEKMVPPDPVNARDVLAQHPTSTEGTAVIGDEIIVDLVRELNELEAEVKPKAKEIEAIKDRLKVFMGEAEQLLDERKRVIATWKSDRVFSDEVFLKNHPELRDNYVNVRTYVDRKKLQKTLPEIYSTCRVPGVRKFLPKKTK